MNINQIKTQKCRHIFTAGNRCQSPALRGEPFCYFHHDQRNPVSRQTLADRRARSAYFDFNLPDPTDRLAIQLAILEVAQRLAANSLDPKRAGRILYALQMVLYANPRPARETTPTKIEIVEEAIADPTYGTLAPEAEIAPPKQSVVAQLLQQLVRSNPTHQTQLAAAEANQPTTQPQPAAKPEPAILPTLQATADPQTTRPAHRRRHRKPNHAPLLTKSGASPMCRNASHRLPNIRKTTVPI